MRKLIIGGAFIISLINNKSFSQEQESALDPITVTSSLTKEKASQTGRNIFVISGERFSSLPVHSIDELLRYLPGIEMQARGPFGAQSDLVVRGGTFQQVLVIVDGIRLNDPNTGHFSSYIPIAPSEIERIELLKGASSSVYGSEAVGGVIHIITKSFNAQKDISKSTAGIQLTAGEYDLFSVNAGGFTTNGKSSFGAGILSNNTKGQAQRGTRGFVYAHTASASFGHHFNDKWKVAIRSSFDDRDFSAQNFYTTFLSDTSKERVKTLWNQFQLSFDEGGSHNINVQAGYKKLWDKFSFNSVALPNENISDLLQGLITDEWRVRTTSVITTGLQFINKKIASNDRGNHAVKQTAAFAILNQQIGSNFHINPSLRWEWNERAGTELIPQVNISYRTSLLQLRGSAGKTIRDADFTERFNNYNKRFVASGRIGNPDLQSERSFSYEAGIDYFSTKALRISVSYFRRNHTNLIDYVVTPYNEMPRKENLSPTGRYALAKNIAEVKTTGIETDIQYVKTFESGHQVWSSFSITWLNSKSSNAIPSFYISSHAKYLSNFNIIYSNNFFSFGVNGLYKQRTPQTGSAAIAPVSKEYFVLNTKADAFIWKKSASAFIEIDNLFNTQFSDLLGAKMPGRWIMGGLKFSLSKK